MKKFYYKKEESLDKTPIILRLDRRHTVNVNKDGVKQEIGKYSSRATSISSLDQLQELPILPRARIRATTKSLSEDIFNSTPSTVLITETELSSSWLYKNMKAAANHSESEYRTPRSSTSISSTSQQSLSPVILQDPKMKPVPVPISRPEKMSSCCCNLAIMIIIGICTLGFISTIGGIIYLEVVSNKSVATNPTTEIPTDALDPVRITQAQDISRTTELRNVVNSKPENRRLETHDIEETMTINGNSERKTIHFLDFGKPLSTELTQFIDKTKTEIRLHKDDSIKHEEKTNNSVKYEENSNIVRNIVDTSNDVNNEEKVKDNSSQNGEKEKVNKNVEKLNQNSEKLNENLETTLVNVYHDSISEEKENEKMNQIDLGEILHSDYSNVFEKQESESKSEISEVKKPNAENNSENFHLDIDARHIENGDFESLTDLVMQQNTHDQEGEKVNEILDQGNDENIHDPVIKQPDPAESQNLFEEGKQENLPSEIIESKPEIEIRGQVDTAKSQNLDEESEQNNQPIESEPEVNIMEQPFHDVWNQESKVFSNRNGDMHDFNENAEPKVTVPSKMSNGAEGPVVPSTDFSQLFQQEIPRRKVVKRPTDMKFSLAEAMKHLQVLDIKVPSSRTKSTKPKVKLSKPRIRTELKKQEEMEAVEKMRYLQKLRYILYQQMQ